MLRITEVEIEGFRGFTQNPSIKIKFENPVTLLYGGNHQGKSSVLNAIEWCLYGDACIGEKSGIRERVGTGEMAWRVVNDNSERAQVKLKLEGEEGEFTITRVEGRGRGRRGRSIRVRLPDGTEKEGNEAEQELTRLLRVSFKDFATTVYQHQENIHDFVIQTPSEQSDVMDRLLGLSDYRNILDGIENSDISRVQRELAREFDLFQASVNQAIKIRQKDLNDKRDIANEKGLSEEELNEDKLYKLSESIIEDINKFAQTLGLTTPAISPLSDWKNTEPFITNVRNECNRLWAESPDVKEQSKKLNERGEANSLKSQYDIQYRNFKSKEKELQDFERENGNAEEIDKKIRKTIEEIEDVDKKIKRTSPKAKLVEEGISILQSAAPPDANICPLCGKEVPNLLDHLQKKWEEEIKAQVERLNEQKRGLEEKRTALENLKKKHARLVVDTQREKEELKKVVNRISGFLHKELTDKDDPAAILSSEIKKIDSRLKEIENTIKSKRSTLEAISEKTHIMRLLYDILLSKNKLEEIKQIENTNEYQTQDKIRDDVSNLVRDVEELSKIIKSCMLKEAEEKIGSAKSAIDYYFRKITNNPAIQTLNIKVEEDKRTGGNFYIFEDQDGKRPVPILSQGDLNSLALSIFLGLAKTSGDSHPLGFILIDDPSQSIDSQLKERFVEILNELSDIKNIILSTMDPELQNLLRDGITKVKTIYKFSDWAPDSGPKISEER